MQAILAQADRLILIKFLFIVAGGTGSAKRR
jgi:hypothetical protein